MINEKTGILEIPYNLVTLSKATGNPMIDLGYQCSDMRPFFKYQNGSTVYYTTVNPKNGVLQEINVYTKYSRNVNGIIQDAMMYQGYTSATTASTITYNGVVYNYTNTYENIRMYYTNMWARYKPVGSSKISELTDAEFQALSYGVSAKSSSYAWESKTGAQGMLEDLKSGNFYWQYTPPQPNSVDYFRMTDFIGYYSKAQSPFYLYLRDYSSKIYHKDDDGYNIYYVDNKEGEKVTLNVKIGADSSQGPTNPSLNWHDVTAVFGENSNYIIDYTDPNEMENIAEFYQDKGYGLVFYNGNDYYWSKKDYSTESAENIPSGKDASDMRYPVCEYIPANPNEGTQKTLKQEHTIPISVYLDKKIEIGGVIFNGSHSGGIYYLPVEPLTFKLRKVPDLIKPSYKFYADGNDFVVEMTIQRNGFEWYWSVYNNTSITGVYISQSGYNGDGTYAPNNGYLKVTSRKQTSGGDYNNINFIQDNVLYRECWVRSQKVSGWNGWINAEGQVTTPKYEIPNLNGIDSAIIKLTIPEFTSFGTDYIWSKEGDEWQSGIVETKIILAVETHTGTRQVLEFDLGGKEIFNGLGEGAWPNISTN